MSSAMHPSACGWFRSWSRQLVESLTDAELLGKGSIAFRAQSFLGQGCFSNEEVVMLLFMFFEAGFTVVPWRPSADALCRS